MSNDGSVKVPVRADTTSLQRGLKNAKSQLKSFGTTVRSGANDWAKYSAVATGAMVATTAAIYKARSESIDSLAKTADALALTTEKLQALNHVAELNGVTSEQMSKGLQRMERGLGEAARKGGTTADALTDVGVNLDEIIDLSPDKQIQFLADALADVDNQAMKASIASDLFGRDGVRMLKVLTQLRKEGVDPTAQKLANLGVSMSRIDAAQVEAANDAFFEAKQVIEGAGNALTVQLAPFVQEVSERFTQAAKDSKGFGDEIQSAIEKGMRIAGKFGDFLQGLRVAFKGLELTGVAFGSAVITAFELQMEAVTRFADGAISAINVIIDGLNKIPNVNIANVDPISNSAFMQGLRNLGDESRNKVGELRSEFHDLAMQELPSDKINSFLQTVVDKSTAAAESVASVSNAGTLGGGYEGGESSGDEEFEKRLKQIQSRYVTEQEALRQHQIVMDDIERAWRENKFLTESEYFATKEMAQKDHEARLLSIREQGEQARENVTLKAAANNLKGMGRAFQQIGSLMDGEGRKSFERTKKLSMASAAASLPSAVIQSFQNGGGYPFGLIPAGLMLATGLKNINDIRKTTYGGGSSSSASASSGSSSSADTSASSAPTQSQTLSVSPIDPGAIYSGSAMLGFGQQIYDFTKDGGQVQFGT